jgi:large subunit ribosomal protein L10
VVSAGTPEQGKEVRNVAEKMSKGRKKRAEQITDLKRLFQSVQGGVLTDFCGLNMAAMTELRRKFREQGIGYRVVKNTLTRIAIQGTDYQSLEKLLIGPIGVAFTSEDPIGPARVAVEFAKDHEALELRGGFMEGEVLSEAEVREISKIPGKQELKAQFLAVFCGSSQRFLGVLNAAPQKFLGVLMARSEKLEGS